jgi:hypothetical protein
MGAGTVASRVVQREFTRAPSFSARSRASLLGLYLKVTSSVSPSALIAPGVLLLLSCR